MYKRASVSNLRCLPSTCILKKISNIPILFSFLPKTISAKMKISYLKIMFLFAGSTPISQALSLPHWRGLSNTQPVKRAPRVAYAGINIAGCDFGIDTNVSSLHSTLNVR